MARKARFFARHRQRVLESDVPHKDEVLDILNNVPIWVFDNKGNIIDGRKRRLGMLYGGSVYKWLLYNVFPDVRRTTVRVRFNKMPPLASAIHRIEDVAVVQEVQEYEILPPIPPMPIVDVPDTYRKTVLAFKTNLLTTAVSWLNVGMEIPFAKNKMSFVYDHQFPWWTFGENKNEFCMRHLQMSAELRWWFYSRKKPATRHNIVRDRLSGHFLAAYGMVGKYDFQWQRKICYQGEYWSAGLTYGYSTPIANGVNLEFYISAGYAVIPYRHYFPANDYSELFFDPEGSGKLKYIGPTKAGISLIFPITAKRNVKINREE